jgi:hypothetical protein
MKDKNKWMKSESLPAMRGNPTQPVINPSGSDPAQHPGDVGGAPQDHNRNTTTGEDLHRQAQDVIDDEPQNGRRRYKQENG